MKRLIACVAVLCCMLSAPIFGVIEHGRAHPGTTALTQMGLDMCMGKPCYLGIIPGVTLWRDVSVALGNHIESLIEFRTATARYNTHWTYVTARSMPDTRVWSLKIIARGGKKLPPVGEFILRYGLPCSVWPAYGQFTLVYPSMTLEFNAHAPQVTPDLPAVVINLLEPQRSLNIDSLCQMETGYRWSGFMSLLRYRDRWLEYTQ